MIKKMLQQLGPRRLLAEKSEIGTQHERVVYDRNEASKQTVEVVFTGIAGANAGE